MLYERCSDDGDDRKLETQPVIIAISNKLLIRDTVLYLNERSSCSRIHGVVGSSEQLAFRYCVLISNTAGR